MYNLKKLSFTHKTSQFGGRFTNCTLTGRHLEEVPLQNEKFQSSGAPALSLNHEAETNAAYCSVFFPFLLHKKDPLRSLCFVLQPEWTSQRELPALGSHCHQ